MDAAELQAFLYEIFPQQTGWFVVETVDSMAVRMRHRVEHCHLRPGGSVSGPTLFAAADGAFYAAVLAMVGRKAMAVTSNVSMSFMRRPPPADLIAEARILKLGRLLATGDVLVWSDGLDQPVAQASVTYAIPPGD